MKKLRFITLVISLLLCAGMTAGCKKRQDPESYLNQELQRIRSGKADVYEKILQDELAQEEIKDFPDELEKAYSSFLKEVYKNIRYEAGEVKEESKGNFRAEVSVEPLNLSGTVAPIHEDSMKNMQSDNLATQVKEMMLLDQDQLSQSVYESPVTVWIRLTWDSGKEAYVLNENDYMEFLDKAVIDKLAVYDDVAEIFDIKEYVQACLDASFKGEFEEYCRQTGLTEEEAREEYESSFWDEGMDSAGFSEEEKTKMISSMKKIASASAYTVSLPKKEDDFYLVPVKGTENLSLKKALKEIEDKAASGDAGDEEAMRKLFLDTFRKYAEAPVMGETFQTEVHVSVDSGHLLSITQEDSRALAEKLLPQADE